MEDIMSGIDILSVSTEGIVRITKKVLEKYGIKPGDRIVLNNNDEKNLIGLQFQRRDDRVYMVVTGTVERY